VARYDIERRGEGLFVDEDPLVFFHYHRVQLRRRGGHAWEPPGYPISEHDRRLVYDPYLAELDEALSLIRTVEPAFSAGIEAPPPPRQRLADARTRLSARAVERFPFLLRVRYPRGLPGSGHG
jgi:hypothetical protein